MYWQEQTKYAGKRVPRRDGRTMVDRMVETERSWQSVGPLPAGDADRIAHYLKDRGFRLRPDRVVRESAVAEETAVAEAPAAQRPYRCERHARPVAFTTWRQYVEHCRFYKEDLQNVPAEVRERAKEFRYYCPLHDEGFQMERLAKRHVSMYRIAKGLPHPTLAEMEQKAAA